MPRAGIIHARSPKKGKVRNMKIVTVKVPGVFAFFLRKMFGMSKST